MKVTCIAFSETVDGELIDDFRQTFEIEEDASVEEVIAAADEAWGGRYNWNYLRFYEGNRLSISGVMQCETDIENHAKIQ